MTNEEARLQVIEKCRKDLLFFGKIIAPKIFYLPSAKFHQEMASLLMDRSIKQLAIQAPRGFAKSTINTRFILHHILFDEGEKVVVIQSKTQPEAINRLTEIKNILDYSKAFKAMFGYCGRYSPNTRTWTDKKIRVKIWNSWVTIKAIGTGMPARGALESSGSEEDELELTRITLYFLDDPDDEDNTATKEQMVKNLNKFTGSKEGMDKRNGRVIVVGTPIREGCIVDVVCGAEGWVSKIYKARWIEDEKEQLLWKEMRDSEWLNNKKKELESIGLRSKYYSEFECTIVGDEDKTFKDWKTWDGTFELKGELGFLNLTKKNGIELPISEKIPVNFFVGIDPASSTKKSADYSVSFVVAYDADKNIYCLYYYRQRVSPLTHAEQIIDMIKSYKPRKGCVETIAYQEMLRQYLRQRLTEEGLYLSGLEQKWNPRTEKSARLETLQPFFASGKIWVKEGMNALEEELNMYPRGKNDDLLDGLYYATRLMYCPDHTLPQPKSDIYLLPRERNEIKKEYMWMS